MSILLLPQEVAICLHLTQVLPAKLASENAAIFLEGGILNVKKNEVVSKKNNRLSTEIIIWYFTRDSSNCRDPKSIVVTKQFLFLPTFLMFMAVVN